MALYSDHYLVFSWLFLTNYHVFFINIPDIWVNIQTSDQASDWASDQASDLARDWGPKTGSMEVL
jgi:hypothetical protein